MAGGGGGTAVEVVAALIAAIAEGRTQEMLALVDPAVIWQPVVRPGRSAYFGRDGMVEYAADMAAAHGRFRIDVGALTADSGAEVTALVWLTPRAGDGGAARQPFTAVFTVRNGLVTAMESWAGHG